MSELVRSVGLLSFQKLLLGLLGAARTKIAAAALGPAGMGLLAQATSFQDLIRQIAMLGSANGFLKLVAEYRGRGERRGLERLIVTAVTLFGGITLAIAALCVVFGPSLSRWVFNDDGRATLILLSALVLVFTVPVTLIGRVFSGSLDLRAYVALAVFDAAIGVVAMAILVWGFGLSGAVASFVVVEVSALIFGAVLLWRRVVRPLGLDLSPRLPDPAIIRRLVRYAGALSLTSLFAVGSVLLVRGELIREFGSQANGYYQVAWQVGQNYLGILGASLWTYGMPKVASKLEDSEAIVGLQNDFLRIALAVLAPGIVVALCTRELWVPLLYTRAFLVAGTMLCWQLSGELLAMCRQTMNISLLPRERLGFLVVQAIVYWGGWALLSLLLMPRLGPVAVAFGYFAANLVVLLATYAYHSRALGYRVRADNLRLLRVTLPGFLLAVVLASRQDLLAGRLIPLGLAAACLSWNWRLLGEVVGATSFARRAREG